MNIFAQYSELVTKAAASLKDDGALPADLELPSLAVEPPRDPSHGDLATNAAMVLAKSARMKPRELAEKLAARLRAEPEVAKAEVAGPGFINLTLHPAAWHGVVKEVLKQGRDFGCSGFGLGRAVNIEYVSANPTGPMHVGHCRGAVFGDALANLLAFVDFAVTREYYINDAGAQVDVLARSVFLRYREALGEQIGAVPEGLYPGDYLKPVGAALAARHGERLRDLPEAEWLPLVRREAITAMMAMIKEDLAALDIRHDVFFSEHALVSKDKDEVAETIAELEAKGVIFQGRLPRPLGHEADDWEDREQTLFRSTGFGDDVDRALRKSDGSYTYFASDVAYHHNKLARGFRILINVFGADHAGYLKRIVAAVKALSGGAAEIDIKVVQLVKLFKGGQPYKMSKRAGTFVTLREVVEEVGRDPVRFMMLYRKNDAPLDFDLDKVVEQCKDNPVYYVQYGHARCSSLFRRAAEALPGVGPHAQEIHKADLALLVDQGELALMKRLAEFPRLIEAAAAAHEPHRISFYLYELASALHAQWNRGTDLPHLRFIQENNGALTTARLALVAATAQALAIGLGILGVHAPEEMR